jgi:hypothetical protein
MIHSKGSGLVLKFSVYYKSETVPVVANRSEEKREGISEMTEQGKLCGATYSISIISMRCPIRVHSLTDVESPENSCNRNEERLFGNLLTWTYSSSPSK